MGDISNWTSPIIGDPTKRRKKLIEDVDRADLIEKLQEINIKKQRLLYELEMLKNG